MEHLRLDDAAFEDAVADALDLIPDELARLMSNVAVLVEDEPPREARSCSASTRALPLTERDGGGTPGRCRTGSPSSRGRSSGCATAREELLDEIAVTVVHEVAHHFGIDDARLHELGWG